MLPSPACPHEMKTRDRGILSKIPPGSDIFEAFAKVRADKDLTDEEAFLELLATYDIPLSTLTQVSAKKLEVSFSSVTYKQIAPYVWLDPNYAGRDMLQLDIVRSRIPTGIFRDIVRDVEDALRQYGPLDSHDNEETRSRFISSLFTRIVCVFNSTVVNKPGTLLEGEFTRKGRIEHHFVALDSVSIVVVEVEKAWTMGKQGLDVKGQVLAECAASDYANMKQGHWVPILAISPDIFPDIPTKPPLDQPTRRTELHASSPTEPHTNLIFPDRLLHLLSESKYIHNIFPPNFTVNNRSSSFPLPRFSASFTLQSGLKVTAFRNQHDAIPRSTRW